MGTRASVLAVVLCGAVALTAGAQSADQAGLFKEAALRDAALRRELATARPGTAAPTQQRVRTLVGAFEDLARIFPATGQADKALWQGASLSAKRGTGGGGVSCEDSCACSPKLNGSNEVVRFSLL